MSKKLVVNDEKLIDIHEYTLDIFAAQQLQALLPNSIYLPFSTASLRYASIAALLNDIVVNKRKNIVEFGSGITTYLIAKLLSLNKIEGAKLYTVDDNGIWLSIVKNLLESNDLLKNVSFIHAPLCNCTTALNNTEWYDTAVLIKNFEHLNIDCVLIDGPAAWHKKVEFSRYPALPFLYNYLHANSAVFLDDINRQGEKEIIELWKKKFQFSYQKLNSSFAGLFRGEYFNIRLFENVT